MRGRWELSDAQWQLIEPILRPKRRSDGRGRPWRDTRAVLNGILWILGTGAPWRELPKTYLRYQTCHRRFQQWVREGKLERILHVLLCLASSLSSAGDPLGIPRRELLRHGAARVHENLASANRRPVLDFGMALRTRHANEGKRRR